MFMLNSAEHEIFPAHKSIGILTFMRRKKSVLGVYGPEKC